ncbi:N-acetylmuramoyl-L-alanine amidase [Clostridium estertheticum]|uniref:N-acetylmuramoyl-L-alanine amidase n=1 Tax=Clostridium estertheticum TaxID=238834 RepID=UPI001C6E0E73|nr:N-acetylmuramoyl-L-alanine amidase [Clostridium estertheticum]MBW9170794.1 N-acetylmuramoyl-L-alanine amidase [Clostridium estertheticum]WLC74367.1 N-acetylmuramoyl-L-alanine amidase [Clostridium estertheticum]
MAIISWDEGHGTGDDVGADGFVNEEKVIREYAPIVIAELERHGHTCINCTPPSNTSMTVNQSLAYRTLHSNNSGSILHLCFHVNAYDDVSAHGAEIEYASSTGAKYATSVLTEICKLGFTNRGIKNPRLWMTYQLSAVSILIEPFFCTNSNDCNLYNKTTLGLAIAKGILNIIGGTITVSPVVKPVAFSTVNYCLQFQKWFNLITQTSDKLIEDGFYGVKTQAKYDAMGTYIKK